MDQSGHMKSVFFYGLFMDKALLIDKGFSPTAFSGDNYVRPNHLDFEK